MIRAIAGITHTQPDGVVLVPGLDDLELTLKAVELPLVVTLKVPVAQKK